MADSKLSAERTPAAPLQDAVVLQTPSDVYHKNIELAKTNKTLTLLRKIDEIVLSSVDDESRAMERIAITLAEESGFPFAVMYQRDSHKGLLIAQSVAARIGDLKAQQVVTEHILQHAIALRYATSPAVRALRSGLIVTVSDLFEAVKPSLPIEEAEDLQHQLGLRTFFLCPLQSRGQPLGVMLLGSSETPDELGFYQKSLLERLTTSIGIAVDNAFLYRETQEAAKRLRTANRHLKELDKAKDEFLSVASHQLRTPLTNIKGYISMLMEEGSGPLTKQQQQFLEVAFANSQRMASLITDLLNASRISAGKFVIEQKPANLAIMAAEEVEHLQYSARKKDLKLTFTQPQVVVPLVLLDETKTRQVIINFIDNAIFYTKEGSITVSVEQVGDYVELRVHDTGIGVPKGARAHLFDKFYRAPNAQLMRPDGSGLGLYLAKRVIDDQSGTLIVTSTIGKGSTFGFSLPLSGIKQASG